MVPRTTADVGVVGRQLMRKALGEADCAASGIGRFQPLVGLKWR